MKKTIALLSLAVVLGGCATILRDSSVPVNISSTPASANVEIKRSDGNIVGQGQTPMVVKLAKGKGYTVTISLDGYQTQIVSVNRGPIDPVVFCNLGLVYCSLIGGITDYMTGAMFNLEPTTINVSLQEVTAQDGGGTAIYAFLTIVDEDGGHQHATVEMTPVTTD